MPHGIRHTTESVLAKVIPIPEHPCWEWGGQIGDRGYGRVKAWAKKRRAHIVVWELLRGPIPEGLELDHCCGNKRCVNPEHLEPVTHLENVHRALARRADLAVG
jgi:hypothetical protein